MRNALEITNQLKSAATYRALRDAGENCWEMTCFGGKGGRLQLHSSSNLHSRQL